MNFGCYNGKKVLVTGHTGFKGSWLCEWLLGLGAEVYGISNGIPTKPALFTQLQLTKRIRKDIRADIRDATAVHAAISSTKPDFIFHLAAQPLVRYSYAHPLETFDANVMGTAHVLDACRVIHNKCSVVCITTDKVYENNETGRPFKETDAFGGYDPYSASKGACEIVISSYRRSFFNKAASPVWISSARAGNVIGGGDWAQDRIIPDCFRAIQKGEAIPVRNKVSTRPWQHVLEPLSGYLTLGEALDDRKDFETYASGFNFGPNPTDNRTVKNVVEELLKHVKGRWVDMSNPNAVHEAGLLNLDIRKAANTLKWKPHWDFETCLKMVAEWYVGVARGENPLAITQRQIREFSV